MDGEDPSNASTFTPDGNEPDVDGPSVDFGTFTLPDEGDDGLGEELVFEPEPDIDLLDP